jgi:hypothetical protein
VHALPPGRHAAREHNAPDSWHPSLAEIEVLPHVLTVQEESSAVMRVVLAITGCLNLRALSLHFSSASHGGVMAVATRPCKLGSMCCCPLEMTLVAPGPAGPQVLGKVQEACSCGELCAQCCLCTCTHNVLSGPELNHAFSLRNAGCCCGRVNNCCGATCCKRAHIIDVLAPDGKLLTTVQKTYGGAPGGEGLVRCAVEFDNYIVEFPPHATPSERALLLNAVLAIDYAYFSRTGGEDDE